MILMFAGIGFMRGWAKELVATAGIVLALFTLKQFESIVIDPLTNGEQASKFYLQATILLAPLVQSRGAARRHPRGAGGRPEWLLAVGLAVVVYG